MPCRFLGRKARAKEQELTLREKGKEISGNKRGKSSVSQTGASDHIYFFIIIIIIIIVEKTDERTNEQRTKTMND